MNTIECIRRRMSVRNFNGKKVEREKLELICEAGLAAPTAMNSRDIVLSVVSGKRLELLNSEMEKSIPESRRSHFYQNGKFCFYRGGDAVIVVSLGKKSVLPEQNTGCIMENMYLAATELGLGACWINQFYDTDSDRIKEILGVDGRPFAGLSVGYYDVPPARKERDGKVVFLTDDD